MSSKLVTVLRRGRLSAFLGNDELAEKVLRGGFWVSLALGVDKVLGLVRSVVLARLLFPEDFGLMSVVMVAMVGLEVFTNATTGVEMAIVQHKRADDRLLNTAWTVSILRGTALWFLLFFSAPLFSSFFHRSELTPLLRAASVVFFISGLRNVGLVLLQKEMDFRRRSFLRVLTNGTGTLAAVVLAVLLRDVWALVIAYIIESLVRTVGSYFVHPFRPRFDLDPECWRRLFRFAKFIFIQGIVIYFISKGDDIAVGKILGIKALGFYTLAYMVVNMFRSLGEVIWEVTFPAYSKVQDDRGKLEANYLRTLRWASFLILPAAGLLFCLAPEIVEVVYGPKWLPAVVPMRMFCFLGGFVALASPTDPVFLGVGRPDISFKISLCESVSIGVLILPSIEYLGVTGAALAVTLAGLFNAGLQIYFLKGILPGIGKGILKNLAPPLASVSGMVLVVGAVRWFWGSFRSLGMLVGALLLGSIVYLAFYYGFEGRRMLKG